jgi:hypothetical protein
MELNKGNKELAKSHLTSSAFYSNNNKRQRAQSYEKLGDISFADKNYVYAQKYYDSSSRFITEDYPNGEQIKSKASKLADLVKAIETAQFEDSVQRIAALSEKDREDFLKETLKQIKREEQRRKELEAAKLLALQQSQTTATTGNANKFIFNNPKLREDGYNEFRKNWGVRENTDDWRRSERIILNANIDPLSQDSTQQAAGGADGAGCQRAAAVAVRRGGHRLDDGRRPGCSRCQAAAATLRPVTDRLRPPAGRVRQDGAQERDDPAGRGDCAGSGGWRNL